MVGLLDLLLLLILAAAVFYGRKQLPLKQLIGTVGLVASMYGATLLYRQLAFLTEQSGMRVLVLAILVLAVGFLVYDICLNAGDKLVKVLRIKKVRLLTRPQPVGSAVIAVAGAIVMAWLSAGILGGSQVAFIQQQLDSSLFVTGLNKLARPPSTVRQVAHLLGPFSSPQVFINQEPDFDSTGDISATFSTLDVATEKAKQSVAKVSAWGCGSASVGSGVIIDGNLVVTNAHVVAGADRINIQSSLGTLSASPVFFDPQLDVAVLRAASVLSTQPLVFSAQAAPAGTIGSALGYPGGGDLVAGDGIIMSTLNAEGYDIYGQTVVTRQIYAFRGRIVPGNSGGPLVNSAGVVIGLIFGHSTAQANTGFAIPSPRILTVLETARKQATPVGAGSCTNNK